MAARSSALVLHEKWREKIRASMLINRLRNHVLGRIEMSPTQLKAAEILLRKVVPDVSAININATDAEGRPIAIALVAYDPTQVRTPALPAPDPIEAGLRH
jgi:hypothetical protein